MSKEIKDLKIVLAGSGGSGKTTLMSDISVKYDLPIVQVETKSMMPEGVKSHLDIIKMATQSPSEGIEFQSKLIKARTELFINTKGGLISDRSVADSFVYYSLHNSMFSTREVDIELSQLTYDSINAVDLTVVLAPNLSRTGIPSNGVRVESVPYYNAFTSSLMSTVHSIAGYDGIIDSSAFDVTPTVGIQVLITPNTAVAFLNESMCENGIATSAERLEAIEVACKFILMMKK